MPAQTINVQWFRHPPRTIPGDQRDQAARHDLGWLNPRLYALGEGRFSPLDDTTRGNNTVTWVQPSTNQAITVHGYNATPGCDLASGFGDPVAARASRSGGG